MSKQIDERVVEMRFDNAQFEKNVSTTMSTLEKLKQSLNLTGAAKGLDDINVAVKKFDMSSLSNGVDTVGLKFNWLYSVADQTFRRITDSALNSAKRIASAFTIDPITTGFNEYELKMGAIQTIMASTGESLETVNKYLNELNEYSDQTIYSFSDMTQNIGKFTNAGVKLEDAVMAIKGISNEAAVSGANANEASRAMYNFAQALSAGYVKLIDWKSIENANMATVEFKNQLLEAAVAAGTLEKTASGMYKVLSTNTQGSTFDEYIDSTHYFNDSLNYQWMTTEALVSTLKAYASESTDIGKKAKAAATEIKTLTMMMDTLKESAQSGWATTWEIIVGDFETAKNMWTVIGGVIGDVINDMSDARNNLLRGALLDSGWDRLTEALDEAGVSTKDFEDSLHAVLQSHGEDVDGLIDKYGSFKQIFRNEAWGSEYIKEALRNIKSELIDLSGITRNLGIGATGEDVKKIQQALKAAGFQCGEFGEQLDGVDGKLGEVTTEAIKAFQKTKGLKVDGIVGPETLAALEEYTDGSKKLSNSIDDVADSIGKISGRELLIEGVKNILTSMKDVLIAIKTAWDNVFDGFTSLDLYTTIERFHKFTKELKLSDNTISDITSTFEGLFTILKVVKDIFVAVISTGAKIAWAVFKPLAKVVISTTSAFGKFVTSAGKSITNVFKPLGKLGEEIGEMVGDAIAKLSELDFIDKVGEWFSKASDTVSEAVGTIQQYISEIEIPDISGKLSNWFVSIPTRIGNVGEALSSISGLWDKFKGSERGQIIIEGFLAPFKSIWETITSFKLPKFNFDSVLNQFVKLFQYLQNNNYTGIIGGFAGTLKYLKYQLIDLKWAKFEQNIITNFTQFWLDHGDNITNGFKKVGEIFAAVGDFIFGTTNIKLSDILDVAQKILTLAILVKSLEIVEDFSSSIESIATAFENVAKSAKWRAIGSMFLSIGVALGAFAVCMKVIEGMDASTAWRSMGILTLALIAMGGIVGGLLVLSGKMGGEVKMLAASGALLMIAATLAILVYALKQIDGTDFKHVGSSFLLLAGLMGSLALVMAVIGKTCAGANFKSAAALLVFLTGLKMVLDVITAYSEYPWDTINKYTLVNMAAMLIGLAGVMRIATGGIKQGASISGLAFAILAMVLSLKILVGVIEELGAIPVDQSKRGISALWGIIGALTLFVSFANITSSGTVLEKGQRNVNGFAGLATALLAVAITIAILGKLPTDVLVKGGIAVGAILTVFTSMLAILGKSMSGITGFGKITGMIIGMGVIIAALAATMVILKHNDIDGKTALIQLGGISLALLAMAACLSAMSKMNPSWSTIAAWVIAMGLFAAIIVGLSHVLIEFNKANIDSDDLVWQFGAIAGILIAMAACIAILSKLPMDITNLGPCLLGMAGLGLIAAALAYLLRDLAKWEVDGKNAVYQFAAISTILVAMSGCVAILSVVGPAAAGALPALGTLALFAIGLVAFLDVLGLIDQFSNGAFAEQISRAVGIMTDVGKAIGGFAGAIIEGISKGLTAALPQMGKDLSDFMEEASGFFGGLGDIKSDMINNAKDMVRIIGEFVTAAGDNGWDNIWASGRSLPNLGTDLGKFMTNASGFFGGLAAIDTDSATAAKSMAETIGIIAKAAEANTGIFNNGFENLGEKLQPFGESMVDFSKTISGKIDTDAVNAAAAAAEVMVALNTKLPKEYGAISGLFMSESLPLDTFGDQLYHFGQAMVRFSSVVSAEGAINATAIENAKNAAALITELKLPSNPGPIKAWFTDTTMGYDTFAAQLVAFGQAMVAFSSVVSAEGAINATAIENAKNAAAIMTELQMPEKNDTFKAWWSGSTISFDTFGNQLVMFGRAMVMFSSVVSAEGAINANAINNAKSAAAIMVALANNMPETTSWVDKWFGDGGKMSIKDFGKQLVKFGEAIVDFSEAVSTGVDNAAVVSAVTVANNILTIMRNMPEDVDMSVMKTALKDLGEAMVSFSSNVSGNVDNDTVLSVASAAKTIAQAASIMPDEVDLTKLTIGLDEFGTAIVSFSETVSGKIDDGSVAAATQAGTDIATMMSCIPQNLVDPTTFIDNLGKLGGAIVAFAESITSSNGSSSLINQDVLVDARTACEQIGAMLLSLSGFTDISYFIENARSLAVALVTFSNIVSGYGGSIRGIDQEAMDAAAVAGTKIGAMMQAFSGFVNVEIAIGCIKQLAQAIVDFNSTITMNTENPADLWTNANYAKQAGDLIVALLKSASEIYDVSPFINGMSSLGTGLVDFSKTVSAEGAINKDAVANAYSAAIYIRNALNLLETTPDVTATIALLDDLGTAMVNFSTTVGELSVGEMSANSESFAKIVKSFGELSSSGVKAFVDNLNKTKESAISAVSVFCASMIRATLDYKWLFEAAGKNMVQGFANGIKNNTSIATGAATSMASAALASAKAALGIKSPSREFYSAGVYSVAGFVNAFNDMSGDAVAAGSDLAGSALRGLQEAIANAKFIIENGVDAELTIRPVLDMSDIETKIPQLASLFDMNPSVGVMANVGAISNGMGGIQNGATNADVVSAIDKLNQKMDSVRGNNYNINGITYSDGSELSEAIQTIVRFATIERRV